MQKPIPFSQALHAWADISAQHSMRGWSQHARATGLSMPQFSILMQLYQSHNRDCGISDIGDRFGISNAAASQHVDNLVQQGLVVRTEDPRDRRAKQIQLSDKGRALIHRGFSARFQWMDQLARMVDPKDQEKVAEALTILTEAAHKLEQSN